MFVNYTPDGWINLARVIKIHDVWSTEASQAQLLLWVAGEETPAIVQGEERQALLA